MSTTSTSFVYGLTDPQTGDVRYVGKTVRGMFRVRQHGTPSRLRTDRTHKANWIRQLQAAGMSYGVVVLEVVEKEKLAEAERRWVLQGRAEGWPLTNLTDGGEGLHGHVFTEAHRSRISAANSGRKLTEEVRRRLSEIGKARPADPERVRRLRAARPSTHSAETKRKIGAAHRGKVLSLSTRQKLSVAKSRPVRELSTGRRFSSQRVAAAELGICLRSVSKVLSGEFKQTSGYRFAYESEPA